MLPEDKSGTPTCNRSFYLDDIDLRQEAKSSRVHDYLSSIGLPGVHVEKEVLKQEFP